MLSEAALSSLRRLMECREARDVAKVTLQTCEAEYRDAEADVHEALSNGPMQRLNNVDLGEPWGIVSFHAKSTDYGRVVDAEALQNYLEQRAMVDEMSEPSIAGKRLNEEIRRANEEGVPLPDGTDFYTKRYVQITRKKD